MILDKAFIRSRYDLHLRLGAIAHGFELQTYSRLCGATVARRAVRDGRERLAGVFPSDGLRDDEREDIAHLEGEAVRCPVTLEGNRRRRQLRGAARLIEERARRRVQP